MVSTTAAPLVILGFFDEVPTSFSTGAVELRGLDYAVASSSNKDLAAAYGVTSFPAIVALKSFGEPFATYTGSVSDNEAIAAFANKESFPLVGVIGPETYKKYVDRELPLVYLFVDPSNESQRESVIAAAKKVAPLYAGKLSIGEIDGFVFYVLFRII